MPFSIMVDAAGDRFANESESYVDLGHRMLEHDKDGAYWMIGDARHADATSAPSRWTRAPTRR